MLNTLPIAVTLITSFNWQAILSEMERRADWSNEHSSLLNTLSVMFTLITFFCWQAVLSEMIKTTSSGRMDMAWWLKKLIYNN